MVHLEFLQADVSPILLGVTHLPERLHLHQQQFDVRHKAISATTKLIRHCCPQVMLRTRFTETLPGLLNREALRQRDRLLVCVAGLQRRALSD